MNDKIYYEAQLSCPDGRWGMTLTITRAKSHWTCPWFALPDMRYQTFSEAQRRAYLQILHLRTCLENPNDTVVQIKGPVADTASVYTFGDERDHPEGSREYWRALHDRKVREGTMPATQEVVFPLEGAWKCLKNGHWFKYEPPPAWPPWCAIEGCDSPGFVWIVKDDVTGKDWPPFFPYKEGGADEPPLMRPMTDGPPWILPDGKHPYTGRHRKEGEEGEGEFLPEVRPEDQ